MFLRIGTVVWDRDGYHNPRYIWPVGFKSKKYLPSLTTPSTKTGYVSEILDGGSVPVVRNHRFMVLYYCLGQLNITFPLTIPPHPNPPPQFQVTPEDSPGTVFSGASASGVWKQLLDQIASLGVTAKTHASGPEMLGLSNLAVTKAIQVKTAVCLVSIRSQIKHLHLYTVLYCYRNFQMLTDVLATSLSDG